MKNTFITLAVTLMSTTSLAADKCIVKALELVKNLEAVFYDMEGGAQGDDGDHGIANLVSNSGGKKTYKVEYGHVNEDGETWAGTYEVVLGNEVCEILKYKFLGNK